MCVFFFGCSFEWEKLREAESIRSACAPLIYAPGLNKRVDLITICAHAEWPTAACIITAMRSRFFCIFLRSHWERMAMLDLESKRFRALKVTRPNWKRKAHCSLARYGDLDSLSISMLTWWFRLLRNFYRHAAWNESYCYIRSVENCRFAYLQ